MKLNKKLIALIVLIIGVFFLIFGVIHTINTHNQSISISNFIINKINDQEIAILLGLKNDNKTEINKKILYLKFYSDNNSLLYTYQYEIKSLKSNNEIEIVTNIPIEHELVSKYEFSFNNLVFTKNPIFKEFDQDLSKN